MVDERQFKILGDRAAWKEWERVGLPRTAPWSLLAPHERQALRNHGQTLERLNERGGLSPREMMCVLEDRSWSPPIETETQAATRLAKLLTER